MIFDLNSFSWPLFASVVGLCIGSLLNVVIHRLPMMLKRQDEQYATGYIQQCLINKGQNNANILNEINIDNVPLLESADEERSKIEAVVFNLFLPRSHCPQCKSPVVFYDNIPIISWLILRGRCRHCEQSISWQYPLVEFGMMVIAFSLACFFSPGIDWLLLFTFSALLITLAIIDINCQLLPDSLTYPLLWSGLIWHCFYHQDFLPVAISGAIAGYMVLWLIYWGGKLLTHREGLGYGDFKLLAALGAWFGWQSLPDILLVAASVSIVALLVHHRQTRQPHSAKIWQRPLPFGPGLAVAGFWLMISGHIVG